VLQFVANQNSNPAKKQSCEIFDHHGVPEHADLKAAYEHECGRKDHNSQEKTCTRNTCENEAVVTLAESIPSSPFSIQNISVLSQLKTPPLCAAANQLQSTSQCSPLREGPTNGGPKVFVSEMLINQRDLYLELETRNSGDHEEGLMKFQICETTLELPDITFSATSCALVFNTSEFWTNVQVRIKICFRIALIKNWPEIPG
jgi:hypothetical protein